MRCMRKGCQEPCTCYIALHLNHGFTKQIFLCDRHAPECERELNDLNKAVIWAELLSPSRAIAQRRLNLLRTLKKRYGVPDIKLPSNRPQFPRSDQSGESRPTVCAPGPEGNASCKV
jgi:hypothetical protein